MSAQNQRGNGQNGEEAGETGRKGQSENSVEKKKEKKRMAIDVDAPIVVDGSDGEYVVRVQQLVRSIGERGLRPDHWRVVGEAVLTAAILHFGSFRSNTQPSLNTIPPNSEIPESASSRSFNESWQIVC